MDTTYKLKNPVTVDGQTITELTLTELDLDTLIALDKSNGNKTTLEQDRAFFATSCQVAPEVIGKLKQRDWNGLKMRYLDTLGNLDAE